MRKFIIPNIVILISLLSLFSCRPPEDGSQDGSTPDSIKIASFNIEIFGQSKASNQEVMDILVQIIRDFDIVAIQEIRDAAGTAIIILKNHQLYVLNHTLTNETTYGIMSVNPKS